MGEFYGQAKVGADGSLTGKQAWHLSPPGGPNTLFLSGFGTIMMTKLRLRTLTMAAISSTTGSQSAAQYGWQQLRLLQAKQNAQQAEQNARSLERQAVDAQQVADRAQENARALSTQSDRAQVNAGRARQGLAMIESSSQSQVMLASKADQVIAKQTETTTSSNTQDSTSPVVNAQGQLTGTVVNTTA
jgi:HD-GYP domain-containing protein (c-di-GMP phosphodiesterase class II)